MCLKCYFYFMNLYRRSILDTGESSVSLGKIILMFTELCFIELSLLCYQCRKIKSKCIFGLRKCIPEKGAGYPQPKKGSYNPKP